MRAFLLTLMCLFFVQASSAVKDLPDLTDAQMSAFNYEVKRHGSTLRGVAKLSFIKMRGIDFDRDMLRAAEINVYRRFAEASNIQALEDVWREYDPHWGSLDVPINQNIFLISQAYAVTRIAKILTIEGCKPHGEDLVSWRNFIVRKLYEITDGALLKAGTSEINRKWHAFQRYARTYIGLILGNIGDRGLHLESEDKRPLFQESWNAFEKAKKNSTSKRLALFQLYLLTVKNFIPEGYDEHTIKIKIEDLKVKYNTVKESTTSRRTSFLRPPVLKTSEEARNFTEGVAPGTERERHTRGGLFGENIRSKVEAVLQALELESVEGEENTLETASASAGDGDNGHGLREEDESADNERESHPAPGTHQGSAGASEGDLRHLSQRVADFQPSVASHFSESGASSPRTPPSSSSFMDGPSHTPSGRISLAGYLRGVREELASSLGTPAAAAALPMEEINDGNVHDPLGASTNFASPFTLRERAEEKGRNPNLTQSLEDVRIRDKDHAVPQSSRSEFLHHLMEQDEDYIPGAAVRTHEPSDGDSRVLLGAAPASFGGAQARDYDLDEEEEDSDSESEFSHSDEDSPEEDSEDEREHLSPHKKMKSPESNAAIQKYMAENSQTLRKELLDMRAEGKQASAQLIAYIEEKSQEKFSTWTAAYKILNDFLKHDEIEHSASVFDAYLSANELDLVAKIRLWIKEARTQKIELSSRAIAERIVVEENLNIRIFSRQLQKLLFFFEKNNIKNNTKKETILDFLNSQEEGTLKDLFVTFSKKFEKDLKSQQVHKRNFIPLLRQKLENFSKSFQFETESRARAYIMSHLPSFGLELPGQHAKTYMSKFLRNPNHIGFVRQEILNIASLWGSHDKTSLVKQFERNATLYARRMYGDAAEVCVFNNERVGKSRLIKLYKRHVIKDGETYQLKPLEGKEKRKA
ncbi:MAG: hypothetical protein JSS34_03845 [Proteobacteria bacterium]|nr:hypothetical protein [Pseudomonadota bacterium]